MYRLIAYPIVVLAIVFGCLVEECVDVYDETFARLRRRAK